MRLSKSILFSVITSALLFSSNTYAETANTQQTQGIQIIDTYPSSGPTTFDVGLDEPATLHYLINDVYQDQTRNDEAKINHIANIKKINRLDKSNDELLKLYNDYISKAKSIVLQPKIILATDYSPHLGDSANNIPGEYILTMLNDVVKRNSTDYYDYDKERLYLYEDYEMSSCKKPLFVLYSPLSVRLPNCNRPYIKISKEKIRDLVKPFKNEIDDGANLDHFYNEVYMFGLENNNKFVRCPYCLSDNGAYLKATIKKAGVTIMLKTDNTPKKENTFEIYYE